MLQDPQTIRYYQRLTDDMVDLWHRGRRFDEIRLYADGFIACLRHTHILEPYLVHRLEEDVNRFLLDHSNFEFVLPEPETKFDYY